MIIQDIGDLINIQGDATTTAVSYDENLNILNINGVKYPIRKAFNTIVDMINYPSADLSDRFVIFVRGYHTPEDGGGGLFVQDSNKPKNEHNGGTVIDPTAPYPSLQTDTTQQQNQFDSTNTGNGCQVRLFNENTGILVDWFGAKGDGITDDTIPIQKAVNSSSNIIIGEKHYKITKTIFVPYHVSIRGISTLNSIIILDDSFVGDTTIANNNGGGQYLFAHNTINGVDGVQEQINMTAGVYSNFTIDARNRSNRDDIRGIIYAYGGRIENVKFYNMSQAIKTITFTDQVHIYRIHFANGNVLTDTDNKQIYAVELDGLGDFGIIEQCHFPQNQDGVRVYGIYAGTRKNLIMKSIGNGHIYLKNTHFKISDSYFEYCKIETENAIGVIENVDLKPNQTTADSNYAPNGHLNFKKSDITITNFNFIIPFKGTHNKFDSFGQRSDFFRIDNKTKLTIINCKTINNYYGGLGDNRRAGIFIYKNDGTPLTDFNNYSGYLSRYCEIDVKQEVKTPIVFNKTEENTLPEILNTGTSTADTQKLSTGTYYYTVISILDPLRRIMQKGVNEKNIPLTNDGDIPQLSLTLGSVRGTNIIRFLRGTSSGVYTHYVDIPFDGELTYLDNGLYMNGFEQKELGQEDIVTRLMKGSIFSPTEKGVFYYDYAPSRGYQKKGDIIILNNPIDNGDGRVKEYFVVDTEGVFNPLTQQSSTHYVEGNQVQPTTSNGFYYECIQTGDSGSIEPTQPIVIGNTVSDGTVVWKCAGNIATKRSVYSIKSSTSDLEFTNANKGIILKDRTTGTRYRLFVSGGTLNIETV